MISFVLVLLTFIYACNGNRDKKIVSDTLQSAEVNLDSIVEFENSKNEWKRSDIYVQAQIKSDIDAQFDQYPTIEMTGDESHAVVLNYQWKPGQFYHQDMFIQILDSREIAMDTVYKIPNKLIDIKIVYYGMYSNFELFNNLEGTITFKTLQSDYCNVHVSLVGDLSEMKKVEDALILDQDLNILKDYSCYEGYSPENKLGVDLDSIRDLESAKNNDYYQTDIIPSARVAYGTNKETEDFLTFERDSTLMHALVLRSSWRPTDGNNQCICIEIFDTSKIELGTEYSLPNELVKVHGIIYGHMSGANLYKNLNGIIRFDFLSEDYAVVETLLKGDQELNERVKNELIMDDKLFFLKGFTWQRDD